MEATKHLSIITVLLYSLLSASFAVCGETDPESWSTMLEEDLKVSSRKMMMSFDVGDYRRTIQIAPDGETMQIHLSIKIDVSALVLSYHRHTDVHAWFDKKGLIEFVTEIKENGKITSISGKRKAMAGLPALLQIRGKIDGENVFINHMISEYRYTNIENLAYVTALSRKANTWKVLSLFTGEIMEVTTTPGGKASCPSPGPDSCYVVAFRSPEANSTFFYSMDGLLVGAEGTDKQGYYEIKMKNSPAPKKPVETPKDDDSATQAEGERKVQSGSDGEH